MATQAGYSSRATARIVFPHRNRAAHLDTVPGA
jgi:hypothetical protein